MVTLPPNTRPRREKPPPWAPTRAGEGGHGGVQVTDTSTVAAPGSASTRSRPGSDASAQPPVTWTAYPDGYARAGPATSLTPAAGVYRSVMARDAASNEKATMLPAIAFG